MSKPSIDLVDLIIDRTIFLFSNSVPLPGTGLWMAAAEAGIGTAISHHPLTIFANSENILLIYLFYDRRGT